MCWGSLLIGFGIGFIIVVVAVLITMVLCLPRYPG